MQCSSAEMATIVSCRADEPAKGLLMTKEHWFPWILGSAPAQKQKVAYVGLSSMRFRLRTGSSLCYSPFPTLGLKCPWPYSPPCLFPPPTCLEMSPPLIELPAHSASYFPLIIIHLRSSLVLASSPMHLPSWLAQCTCLQCPLAENCTLHRSPVLHQHRIGLTDRIGLHIPH